MKLPLLLCLFLGLVVPGVLAKGQIIDIRWSSDGRFAHQSSVKPKDFVELCGELLSGSTVSWRFSATAPLDFNIHYHAGQEVVFPDKRSQVTTGAADLRVSQKQAYCWMWTNKGSSPSMLEVELRR